MGARKIEAFYDDPVKTACDAWSMAKAYHLRSLTLDNGLKWRARRWARFVVRLGQGTARRLRGKADLGPAQKKSDAQPNAAAVAHPRRVA
jgi:hypothetical protein